MRFAAIHKVTTYLTVLAAHLALALSGELHPAVVVAMMAVLPLSWRWEAPTFSLEKSERYWRWLTVAVFVYLVFEIVLRDTPVILGGVYFVLYLQSNKLFNRRASKDYLQIYVISFLELVAATVFNTDITYALCFGVYVISATWTLILFHLRREMEENYLLRHSDGAQSEKVEVQRILNSRRIIGPAFLAATAAITLVVFLGTTLVFFLFPRIGFGLFFQRHRPGVFITGFDESIELGGFGTLKENPTVVMRVEMDQPWSGPMRWRGIAFDRYDGRSWTKTLRHSVELSRRSGIYLAPGVGLEDLDGALKQDIYLEPIEGTSAVFTFGAPAGFVLSGAAGPLRRDAIRMDEAGDAAHSLRGISVRYTTFTDPHRPPATSLRTATALGTEKIRRAYLQLAPNTSTRIYAYARELTAGATNPYDMAAAVEQRLRTDYRYTVELARGDESLPPLEDFLFVRREGHCEYFSTAMAVLLRTLGIPTRNVNGFLGGEWNSVGGYYAVRHGDAHSWVEVYFDGHGWVAFDPTPPGALRVPRGGVLGSVLEWVDALRLEWFKYVIEYDLGKQIRALREVSAWWSRTEATATGPGNRWRDVGAWVKRDGWKFLVGLVLLLWLLRHRGRVLRLWLRRAASAAPTAAARRSARRATRLYDRMVAAAAKAGWRKEPRATPREFVAELYRSGAPHAARLELFTERYNTARFSARLFDDETYLSLRDELREIESALKLQPRVVPTRPKRAAPVQRTGKTPSPPSIAPE